MVKKKKGKRTNNDKKETKEINGKLSPLNLGPPKPKPPEQNQNQYAVASKPKKRSIHHLLTPPSDQKKNNSYEEELQPPPQSHHYHQHELKRSDSLASFRYRPLESSPLKPKSSQPALSYTKTGHGKGSNALRPKRASSLTTSIFMDKSRYLKDRVKRNSREEGDQIMEREKTVEEEISERKKPMKMNGHENGYDHENKFLPPPTDPDPSLSVMSQVLPSTPTLSSATTPDLSSELSPTFPSAISPILSSVQRPLVVPTPPPYQNIALDFNSNNFPSRKGKTIK